MTTATANRQATGEAGYIVRDAWGLAVTANGSRGVEFGPAAKAWRTTDLLMAQATAALVNSSLGAGRFFEVHRA